MKKVHFICVNLEQTMVMVVIASTIKRVRIRIKIFNFMIKIFGILINRNDHFGVFTITTHFLILVVECRQDSECKNDSIPYCKEYSCLGKFDFIIYSFKQFIL